MDFFTNLMDVLVPFYSNSLWIFALFVTASLGLVYARLRPLVAPKKDP